MASFRCGLLVCTMRRAVCGDEPGCSPSLLNATVRPFLRSRLARQSQKRRSITTVPRQEQRRGPSRLPPSDPIERGSARLCDADALRVRSVRPAPNQGNDPTVAPPVAVAHGLGTETARTQEQPRRCHQPPCSRVSRTSRNRFCLSGPCFPHTRIVHRCSVTVLPPLHPERPAPTQVGVRCLASPASPRTHREGGQRQPAQPQRGPAPAEPRQVARTPRTSDGANRPPSHRRLAHLRSVARGRGGL